MLNLGLKRAYFIKAAYRRNYFRETFVSEIIFATQL